MLSFFYSDSYLNNIKCETETRLHVVEYKGLILPLFEYTVEEGFSCFNSSPYFCSHGGFFKKQSELDDLDYDSLYQISSIDELKGIVNNETTLSFTIISNPYQTEDASELNAKLLKYFSSNLDFHLYTEQKISAVADISNLTDGELMDSMHSKHRNAVRKFLKTKCTIDRLSFTSSDWGAAIDEIIRYNSLVVDKGGLPKSKKYFKGLERFYAADECFIYRARDQSEDLLASCLFFKSGVTLEYWTPIISEKGRSLNALQGLIYSVMCNETSSADYINFGGTNPNNKDLLRFKQRFGAKSIPYYLHNFTNTSLASRSSLTELMNKSPNFYFWRK